ncbi:MAG: hypothetical protein ACKO23_07850 [Gemmataceae bacterium]
MIWIGGYWAWDDDRSDFLWVSGVRRVPPPGKQWVSGYWRQESSSWQWVGGFWTAPRQQAQANQEQKIDYLPQPPAQPETAPPGKPPAPDSFYVPGVWVWTGERYAFRAGYWGRVQPGYIWVQDHYRWTPTGYVFVPGYWDLSLRQRGILYAPVVISPSVLTVGFTYTPAYAVQDSVIVESLFVRPTYCHYYFGDYYAVSYRSLGFESCAVYGYRRYEPFMVYECYERRNPLWIGLQINLFNDRCAGRVPLPPRTIVQNNVVNNTTIINNNTTIVNNNNTLVAPVKQVAVNKNTNLVPLDEGTRKQARVQAVGMQQVAKQRSGAEQPLPPGSPRQVRTASFEMPQTTMVKPGMKAPPSVKTTALPAQTNQSPKAGIPAGVPMPSTGRGGNGGVATAARGGSRNPAVNTNTSTNQPMGTATPTVKETKPAGAPMPGGAFAQSYPNTAKPIPGGKPVPTTQPGQGTGTAKPIPPRPVPVKPVRRPPPRDEKEKVPR